MEFSLVKEPAQSVPWYYSVYGSIAVLFEREVPRGTETAESAEQSPERVTHWDTLLPAFGIRVGSRTKTFIVIDSQGSRRKIGQYPYMTLAEARDKARDAMSGADTRPGTYSEVLDAYVAQHLLKNCRPKYAKEIERILRRDFPLKGQLAHITRTDVTALIDGIDGPSAASHATTAIKMLFSWAEERGYITHNPIAKLKQSNTTPSRTRLLSDQEVAAIWRASTGPFGMLSRCLLLSGQRRGQFIQFLPSYNRGDTICWPANVMKSRQEHTIPLTSTLHHYTTQLTPRYAAFSKPMHALREACGIHDFTLHDYRRCFSSTMRRLKVPIDCTETLLAHTAGSRTEIQRIYDRYDRLPELREALHHYERHLEKVVGVPLS